VCILAAPELGEIVVFGGTTRRRSRRNLRPELAKIKAEAGVGFLGRERLARPLPTSYGVLGSTVSSTSGVWGGASAEIEFLAHFSLKTMTPGGNNFDNFFSGNHHNNLQILDATTDKGINKIHLM